MRKSSAASVLRRSSVVVSVVVPVVVAVCLAACSKDDMTSQERPEPPPPVVDAGLLEAGDQAGCPSSPPRIGENCQRNPDILDQTCSYPMGVCTVEGTQYDWVDDYRCFDGTWHVWNTDDKKCRTP